MQLQTRDIKTKTSYVRCRLSRGDETSERGSHSETKHACRPKASALQLHYSYRANKTIIFRNFWSKLDRHVNTCSNYILMEGEVNLL